MASYSAECDDFVGYLDAFPNFGYGATVAERPGLDDAYGAFGYGTHAADAAGFAEPFFGWGYHAGALVDETVGLHQAQAQHMVFTPAIVEALGFHELLAHLIPISLSDGFGVDGALTVARAVAILQKLGVHEAFSANSIGSVTAAEALGLSDAVLDFFGLGAADQVGFADAFAVQFQFVRSNTEGIAFTDTMLANRLFLRILDDSLGVDDEALPNAIFNSAVIDDEICFQIALLDPGGGFTSWAVNTRSSVISEYQNWAFNSFCQIGNQFYGATSQGLYLLGGDTDSGANIAVDVKGALMQLGGSRFTQLDAVYIGMRASDNAKDFFLKLIVPAAGVGGEDATYVYQFKPRDFQSTRVNIGKGLRARYIQWELVTEGPDFTLDDIEFVPLVAKRRVGGGRAKINR